LRVTLLIDRDLALKTLHPPQAIAHRASASLILFREPFQQLARDVVRLVARS
jgi:hypothetical protein